MTTSRTTGELDASTSEGRASAGGVSRRAFLRLAGRGAGLVAVVGSGLVTLRALDQGVFSTGSGPAYSAWNQWAAAPTQPLDLIRAAVLAANAHDTQPWLFRVSLDRIDLYAVPSRSIGMIDPLRREMFLSLGCALENLVLAAAAAGTAPSVQVVPNSADPTLAASVRLGSGQREISSLYRAIPMRHTNRGPYDTARSVAPDVLTSMESLISETDVAIVWWTSAADKRRFADLTVRAAQAIAADAQQAADDFHWWRGTWSQTQASKDGITIDASGLPPLIRALGKILPGQTRDSYEDSFLSSLRNTQLPTAAVMGTIVVRDSSNPAQRIGAGRAYQRLQLWATFHGFAMQPLNQPLERADREKASGLAPVFGTELGALFPDPGMQPVMPFRLGYPTLQSLPSPRRPAEDVMVRG
ncbi:MAG TPA: hypothetical protein VHK65_06445 [Candidatus Dormibacteraeota bacterium]|nr:hypothetical protein [Candidatus Dormibacteraeota bacterium]